MKKIDEVLEKTKIGEPLEFHGETFSVLEQKIVNKLFVTFEHIFPAFKTSYGTPLAYDGAKRQWLLAFKKHGIGDQVKIKRVCDECRLMESHFMLSLGKFISLYRSLDAYEKMYPTYGSSKLIEVKKGDEQTAKENLARIMAMLKT